MKRLFALILLALAAAGSEARPEAGRLPRPQTCPASVRKVSMFSTSIAKIARQRGVSLQDAADLVRAAGVSGFDASYLQTNLVELCATGLAPVNLYGWPKFLADDGGAADTEKFVSTAVRHGFPRVMVIPDDFPDGKPSEEAFARILAGMKSLTARMNAAGVAVMVEDFGGTNNPCSRTAYLKRFLTEIPSLRFALDSGNLYYAGRGEDILEMMRFAEGRVEHVHLKDQSPEDNRAFVSIGLGAVPNEKIVRTMDERRYDGWFTIENFDLRNRDDILTDLYRELGTLKAWSIR